MFAREEIKILDVAVRREMRKYNKRSSEEMRRIVKKYGLSNEEPYEEYRIFEAAKLREEECRTIVRKLKDGENNFTGREIDMIISALIMYSEEFHELSSSTINWMKERSEKGEKIQTLYFRKLEYIGGKIKETEKLTHKMCGMKKGGRK